jgi:TetR/AcrR family transcriptional regulator, transcriptional repressor for nem operon
MESVADTRFTTSNRRGPGRPREFDMDAALDAALIVFRERGYHAASLAELGSAMKLTVGSIYKAFRDKRAIFLAAFDRYTDLRGVELNRRLETEQSGLDKLRAMLGFYADSSYGSEGRLGCLVVGSATELRLFDAEMAALVKTSLKRVKARFRDLIELGHLDGSVMAKIDPEATASLLLYLVQGFRVVGKTGRTRAEMMAAVNEAMRLLR